MQLLPPVSIKAGSLADLILIQGEIFQQNYPHFLFSTFACQYYLCLVSLQPPLTQSPPLFQQHHVPTTYFQIDFFSMTKIHESFNIHVYLIQLILFRLGFTTRLLFLVNFFTSRLWSNMELCVLMTNSQNHKNWQKPLMRDTCISNTHRCLRIHSKIPAALGVFDRISCTCQKPNIRCPGTDLESQHMNSCIGWWDFNIVQSRTPKAPYCYMRETLSN